MKFKFIIILIVASLLASFAFVSCKDNTEDNEESQESKTEDNTSEDNPAVKETKEFFENLYSELNKGNYSIIKSCYNETEEQFDNRIANFEFMAGSFEVEYSLAEVQASYVDNGNIGADVIVLIKSTEISSGKTTIIKEPTSYLLTKKDGKLIIENYAVGESELM